MGVKIRWIRNKWYLVIDYHGKRISRVIGTDRKAAEKVRSQVEAGLLLEGPGIIEAILGDKPGSVPTLAEYGQTWIKEITTTNLKESTRIRYLQSFRDHIMEGKIARLPLNEISYLEVKGFILQLKKRTSVTRKKGLSRNTIRNTLAVLRLILSEAEADGYIKGNPAANKKLSQFYRESSKREEVYPFSVLEVHQIEELFREKSPWFYPLVVCLFRTGIRAGEARGLRWQDVNLQTRKMTIRRSWSYGRAEATPKTPSSRRTIELSRDLVDVLKVWKTQLKEYWVREGRPDPGLVFPSVNGLPFDLRNFQRRHWDKVQEELGLDIRRVHDTRHTFATILITKGIPITRVAHLLGHSSVKTTLQFYAHYLPSDSDSEDISAALDRETNPQTIRKRAQTGGVKPWKINNRE